MNDPANDSQEPAVSDNDHRELGQRLDLFCFRDEAPGMVFWLPRGLVLYRLLEDAVRQQSRAHGYQEVRTPQIMRRPVWEASGHWQHFFQGMFRVEDQSCEAAVKPVSCPGHIFIVKRRPPSHHELPIRVCELGIVHRDELGGTLHGLLRVRQFTQDDGHIFCSEEQAEAEVLRFCAAVAPFYRAFGFDRVRVALSTRPDDRAGDDGLWDRSEAALRSVLERMGVAYTQQPGAGAFYGPKLEFVLADSRGREWQCGTIQFDLVMPERFDLAYIDSSSQRRRPVMLHRALYGSLERFLGILLEHHGAHLPPWLAPVQVAVLPVTDAQADAAREIERDLGAAGIRCVGMEEDSLGKRIALAHARAIPFHVVLGAREVAGGKVALRSRDGQTEVERGVFVETIVELCRAPRFVDDDVG
jgi:threonyl-tRNA synthetase